MMITKVAGEELDKMDSLLSCKSEELVTKIISVTKTFKYLANKKKQRLYALAGNNQVIFNDD